MSYGPDDLRFSRRSVISEQTLQPGYMFQRCINYVYVRSAHDGGLILILTLDGTSLGQCYAKMWRSQTPLFDDQTARERSTHITYGLEELRGWKFDNLAAQTYAFEQHITTSNGRRDQILSKLPAPSWFAPTTPIKRRANIESGHVIRPQRHLRTTW